MPETAANASRAGFINVYRLRRCEVTAMLSRFQKEANNPIQQEQNFAVWHEENEEKEQAAKMVR